ncbi:MAG: serine/threonine protein kinase, partial [Acidobacteriaceae bacterium]|nr:serine/threonine protein kinase [Acidobacteriaceae bacterium]
MRAELWKQVEDLYEAALQQPVGVRAEFLRAATPNHPEVRAEVESLLKAASQVSSFLEDAPVSFGEDELREAAGDKIGPYQLMSLLGRGGMGEVWLAEQRQPVHRFVAIKLLRAGVETREMVARFRSEEQALALMSHPTIAKVFDAGFTFARRPYFVMEYVPGEPITSYCDTHQLTIPERLRLFIQVCEGVTHAHQKAIIHRDLKPSNILVAEVDGKPVPRIIDFGVAKAISQRLTDDTLVTRVGMLLGTPEYMSPEQADSGGEDIDTRSDVYSLGVILYEMLAGTVPLNSTNLKFEEMLFKLREEDARRPSTNVRASGEQSIVIAQNRRLDRKALIQQLQGDLDAIVLKALEKDRNRRYGGPAALAADIEHYLRHEPVTARLAGAPYRVRKYVRRHRIGVAFAVLLLLLLVAGVGVSSWMAVQASRAKQEAQAVNDFLRRDVLEQASVDAQGRERANKPDPDLKVRTALDRAAAKIAGEFGKEPLVEASIRQTIGRTYFDLGLYPQAQSQLERALGLQKRILGESNPDTLMSKVSLALLFLREGRYKDSEKLYDEAVKAYRRVLGREHTDTLNAELNLATLYYHAGKYAEAENLNRELLDIYRRRLGKDNPSTLRIENNLIIDYSALGRYAQAEPLQNQLVDSMLRVLGPESRDTLGAMGNLAELYGFEGKYAQAEAVYREVVNGLERLEGKADHDTLLMTEGLAWALDEQGKYTEADALYSKVLGAEIRVFGNDHPQTLITMTDMAASYRRRGMDEQAERLLLPTLDGRRRKLGAGHPDTLATMGDLGWLYVHERRYTEAETLFREATQEFEKARSDDWQRYRVMSGLGASLAGERQHEKAEPLL